MTLCGICLQVEARSLTLGEVLAGDRMAVSMYQIGFKGKTHQSHRCRHQYHTHPISTESFDHKKLCTVTLDGDALAQLEEAIEDLYYFEFVYGEWMGGAVANRSLMPRPPQMRSGSGGSLGTWRRARSSPTTTRPTCGHTSTSTLSSTRTK